MHSTDSSRAGRARLAERNHALHAALGSQYAASVAFRSVLESVALETMVCCTLHVATAIIATVLHAAAVDAKLSLPSIFTDGVVLQRGAARLFGFANQMAHVSATVGGITHAADADSTGRWMLDLSESQTDHPVSVMISATSFSSSDAEADERIVLQNVTFGEVSRYLRR